MSVPEERRAHPRVVATSSMRVVHVASASPLGWVGDASIGGLRLHAAPDGCLGETGCDRALRLEPNLQGDAQAPITSWRHCAGSATTRPVAPPWPVSSFTRLSSTAVLQVDAFLEALQRP
jgi:hypothetical protein